VRYGDGDGGEDARIGARVPDLLLEQAGGPPVQLYERLRELGPGRFVRLIVGEGDPGREADAATVAASAVLGPDWAARDGWDIPGTVLIRPDGHVAEAGTW